LTADPLYNLTYQFISVYYYTANSFVQHIQLLCSLRATRKQSRFFTDKPTKGSNQTKKYNTMILIRKYRQTERETTARLRRRENIRNQGIRDRKTTKEGRNSNS